MVDEQQLRFRRSRPFEGLCVGGDSRGDQARLLRAGDLEAVDAVVIEALRLEESVGLGEDVGDARGDGATITGLRAVRSEVCAERPGRDEGNEEEERKKKEEEEKRKKKDEGRRRRRGRRRTRGRRRGRRRGEEEEGRGEGGGEEEEHRPRAPAPRRLGRRGAGCGV
jgi:hypothetical protein